MRLGSDRMAPTDVRIIAATSKDLKQLVSENRFRADLYYRLNVLQLRIPPLRDRKEDIILLTNYFLHQHATVIKHNLELTSSAMKALMKYSWPGNVRELQNFIERLIAMHKHEIVDADIIRVMLDGTKITYSHRDGYPGNLEEIKKALAASKGNYGKAAKVLGISRTTLWRKLKRSR